MKKRNSRMKGYGRSKSRINKETTCTETIFM